MPGESEQPAVHFLQIVLQSFFHKKNAIAILFNMSTKGEGSIRKNRCVGNKSWPPGF